MRSRKTSNRVGCLLFGLLMLRPFMWAQNEVKLPAEPELGKRIVAPRTAELGRCMSSPGQLDKCFTATVNGIKYTVAYRRRGARGNVVTSVHTDDPNFKSPDGLSVGDVATVENPENIIAAPGFEIYGRKGQGWIPVVGFNGEVNVVREGLGDEKQEAKALRTPARLRIRGFTKRGTTVAARANEKPIEHAEVLELKDSDLHVQIPVLKPRH